MGINKTAAKASKLVTDASLENFGPRLLKLARRGKNTVSAERALIGDRITAAAFRTAPAGELSAADEMTTRALTARGPAGNMASREDAARAVLKGSKKQSGSEIAKAEKEAVYDTMVRRMDDNAIHRSDALRTERSAVIGFNGGGYSNPAMKKVSPGMSYPSNGSSFHGGKSVRNQTFDKRSNLTGASSLLADRM